MLAERFDFENRNGQRLAALLNRPTDAPRAVALFAHCFACGKDVQAAQRIAEGLVAQGIAVLRFDFTGLGASEGEFSNATLVSHVADLVSAADHLRNTLQAPAILIGHSLGGAAVVAAAAEIPEARAVVTISAPADPAHVKGLVQGRRMDAGERDDVEVRLGGRAFRLARAFLDDTSERQLVERLGTLRKALLVFHSPTDPVVSIDSASAIFLAAKHPKSFVSLAGADHLLSQPGDAAYVANVVAAWAARYLEQTVPADAEAAAAENAVLVRETGNGKFQQSIRAGQHVLTADEPVSVGGLDSGPDPYDLLLAALGACTTMTLRLYADRKSLPLEQASVHLSHSKIHAEDCESCETKEGKVDRIDRIVTLKGKLDSEQRARLMEIADKCPVHRTLKSEIEIRTSEREE